MAATIDVAYLSGYLSFPEPSLNALVSEPTRDLIESLLQAVAKKAQAHEHTEAERFRLEVELENAVRAAELKTKALKASVDRGTKQVAELREKLSAEEASKNTVETELRKLQTSSVSSDSETQKLKARIQSLESTNRDTLALLETKTTAYSEVSSDLVTKQQKVNELRGEISQLEQTAQSANSATVAIKLREQNLQQEVEVLRRNNDWLDSELKAKSAEYTKFRKEKNGRLAELQQENENTAANLDALQRSERSLQSRLEEITQKADGFLVQIKELREAADRNEEHLRAELDTAKRLENLMEESLSTAKRRQQDLADQLDRSKDDAAEEIGRLTAEAETEHQDRVAAEQRVAELETRMEQLESENASHTQQLMASGRARSDADSYAAENTPSKLRPGLTPSKRGTVSFTQMVDDYHTIKAQLESEKRRSSHLSSTVEEMIRDVETRQPEILEMQADHARMETDLVEMSNYADRMAKEREDAKKLAKTAERELQGLVREGDILRQQLRDMSSQTKVLLMELNVQGQGLAPFSAEQRAQLEQLARADSQVDLPEATDTSRFISQHLTTFRNVSDLVEQNAKLLRVAREVGERMEGEEAQAEKAEAAENRRELETLRGKYESSKDEIAALVTQSQSYIKERDMFRRMLSQRGQAPPENDFSGIVDSTFRAPTTPRQDDTKQIPEQKSSTKESEDYRKLLKEMQSHFDSYRQEAASERSALKDQWENASRKNVELRNELSKKSAEVTLAIERYEMLQGNLKMLKSENSELQSRAQTGSERAAKQELRTQQVVEDLVEAKGVTESMRNENANLKAEKEFWKSIEARLTNDNETLLKDRDRVNMMNANLQTMMNEREHNETEHRRRLEARVEGLESETQTLKRRLTEEQEEHKRAVQRRDYDASQAQSRVDGLTTTLSSTREELVAAKTTRDHLQSRADELSIELRSAEEKLSVLQSKPTGQSSSSDGNFISTEDNSEQTLKLSIAELRKNSELLQTELTSARLQVEQYKAISQGSEDELRSFTETNEQYRQEMDSTLAKRDAQIKDLELKIETLREEISNRDVELNQVRIEIVQHDSKIDEQKQAFETEIARLKDSCERAEAAAQYHQEDLKMQAEIAQQAQQNYESELVKHAEAAKNVQKVRGEYNDLKTQVAELRANAEAAQSKLRQNEESWAETKRQFESEISELRSRRDDASGQNKLLYQQLESVNQQLSELQKARVDDLNGEPDLAASTRTNDSENLNELVRYLRREKEIVDVQHDLATQEARRLRQQLDQVQGQLEETRLKLGQQRRSEEQSERNALNHKKLLDTIEELNLNRESNSALRLEKTQLQSSLNDKTTRIEELQSQLTPLHAQIAELEGKNETLGQEVRLAQDARSRFEQRYLDILNRSNSIDPAEFESVTQKVTTLEAERDELQASQAALKAQVESFPEQIRQSVEEAGKGFQETRQKIIEQSKNRDRAQVAKLKEKDAALQDASQAKTTLEARVKELEDSLELVKEEHQTALEQARVQARVEAQAMAENSSNANRAKDASAATEAGENGTQDPSDSKDDSADITAMREKVSATTNDLKLANAKVLDYETRLATLQGELDQAKTQLSTLQTQSHATPKSSAPEASDRAGNAPAELEQLRQELSQAQHEAEEHRTALLVREGAVQVGEREGAPPIEEQIKTEVDKIRAELTKRHDERVRQLEETYKSRTDAMKAQLSKKLAEGRADMSRKLEAGQNEKMTKLQEEHEQKIKELNERHESELSELRLIASKPNGAPGEDANAASSPAPRSEVLNTLTESEIRTLLQKNEIAKKFVVNSLTNRENKVREEQQKQWTQRIAEAETKAKHALDQAVMMEGKRLNVKMTMAENKSRAANARLEVVKQAATETPEKPVGEVWTIAQNAKPAPGLQQSAHAPAAAQPTRSQVSVGSGAETNATPTRPTAASTAPKSNDTTAQPPAVPSASAKHEKEPTVPATGLDTTKQPASDAKSTVNVTAGGSSQPAATTAPRSGIPQPAGRGASVGQANQARGGANSGRGRGRGGQGGAGRGGQPTINTGTAQGNTSAAQTNNSPKAMSATAKQFVPRKRDATGAGLEGSVHAGDNKRAKPEDS